MVEQCAFNAWGKGSSPFSPSNTTVNAAKTLSLPFVGIHEHSFNLDYSGIFNLKNTIVIGCSHTFLPLSSSFLTKSSSVILLLYYLSIMNKTQKIFHTPIGDFVEAENISSLHTHLIHISSLQWYGKYYIGRKEGVRIIVEYDNSNFEKEKGFSFVYSPNRWHPVNILDRSNPTVEDIKEHLKF